MNSNLIIIHVIYDVTHQGPSLSPFIPFHSIPSLPSTPLKENDPWLAPWRRAMSHSHVSVGVVSA